MQDKDTKRLSRLVAILTSLQSKRLITATYLAEKFGVSVRTIYRDIRALEQSGVPIVTEDGKPTPKTGANRRNWQREKHSSGVSFELGRLCH